MQLSNCKECGKLYRRYVSEICPDCLREEEKQLRQIREYLRQHSQAYIHNVVEDLGIERSRIEKWIRQNKIKIKDLSAEAAKPKCPICGREVETGQTYCRTCLFKQFQAKSKSQAPEAGKPERKGMHYKVKE